MVSTFEFVVSNPIQDASDMIAGDNVGKQRGRRRIMRLWGISLLGKIDNCK
jgi:hypothetical protein